MKKELRKKTLEIRKNLLEFEVTNYSENIVKKIKNSQEFRDSKVIGIYSPIKNEVDITALLSEEKVVCLPRVFGEEMDFFIINSINDLHLGSFNVLEPNDGLTKVDKNDMDIIYVPCVCVSKDFYRIGYGKGFYDRYLKDYKNKKYAVCYEFQIVDEHFEEEFDVRLDGIIF